MVLVHRWSLYTGGPCTQVVLVHRWSLRQVSHSPLLMVPPSPHFHPTSSKYGFPSNTSATSHDVLHSQQTCTWEVNCSLADYANWMGYAFIVWEPSISINSVRLLIRTPSPLVVTTCHLPICVLSALAAQFLSTHSWVQERQPTQLKKLTAFALKL